jgi:hypothetical protein
MSLADTFRRTCSVGLTDSRRPSHALLAYCIMMSYPPGQPAHQRPRQGLAGAIQARVYPGKTTAASTAIVWEA